MTAVPFMLHRSPLGALELKMDRLLFSGPIKSLLADRNIFKFLIIFRLILSLKKFVFSL
jgi:hypothetical protein